MSPSLHQFGRAAEGATPKESIFSGASIMGRDIGAAAALAAFAVIGTGVVQGTVNMSEAALEAKAAKVEIVTPPAFMTQDSSKNYTTQYHYSQTRNEDIGATRMNTPDIKPS